jgi:hypothetical protein
MSRITKEIASQVAHQLTAKKREVLKELNTKFRAELKRMYVEDTPNEIKELAEKYPEYFNFRDRIGFFGTNGFGYENYRVEGSVITKSGDNSYANISSENASKLKKIDYEIEDKKKELKDLVTELEILLYSLRTYAKVSEQFPEAIPFLPYKTTSALAINIEDLRKKL